MTIEAQTTPIGTASTKLRSNAMSTAPRVMVLGKGMQRGRHDDRQRSADRQVHATEFIEAERAQHLVEDRHQHGAAADAEQAGKETRDGAGRHQREHERQKFGK